MYVISHSLLIFVNSVRICFLYSFRANEKYGYVIGKQIKSNFFLNFRGEVEVGGEMTEFLKIDVERKHS